GKGAFKFQLAPGTYTIREVLKKGYLETTPSTATFQLTVGGGQTLSGNDFGDRVAPPKKKVHATSHAKLKSTLPPILTA
ncbi:MAG TPA: hypothetical protein VN541_22125, partial [Tepidisphaeraceae bacterium]|nr:hypothetical protein [Tepidisphaeraceae bacterium]